MAAAEIDKDETSDGGGGGDGFDAFLELINSPSKSNDDVDIEQRSETSTTNSHTAFIDYLKSPDNTPALPPSPTKKKAASSVATSLFPIETIDDDIPPIKKRSNCEAIGDKVDESISGFFYRIGHFCSYRPKTTIALSLAFAILCAGGMAKLNTENRPEKVSVHFVSLMYCCIILYSKPLQYLFFNCNYLYQYLIT